jgi:hypothetical protein
MMPDLYNIPCDLARPREAGVKMLGTTLLIERLEAWKRLVVANYGGDPTGCITANSCYRPQGTTCENDIGGAIDLTDANGHWTGCAVDYSARLTAESFWPSAPKWRRDDIRDSLVAVGLFHPWYWKHGIVGGDVLEYWHIAVELVPWKQAHAYRGIPPHWWDGLRPGSTAIRTN